MTLCLDFNPEYGSVFQKQSAAGVRGGVAVADTKKHQINTEMLIVGGRIQREVKLGVGCSIFHTINQSITVGSLEPDRCCMAANPP